jgi:NRPS condensation-like uncharacterized protein
MEKLKMATERIFLRSPNINVCFRMTVRGNIDQAKFNAAMNRVCQRHPLLNSSIEMDKDREAWFVPNTGRVKIEYRRAEELQDWKEWYKTNDGVPFDFLHGPLAKICVVIGTNQAEIIILGHHIIGDGLGYLNLARDILLALDNKLETVPQIPPANNEFRKEKKPGLVLKLYAKKLNMEWRKNRASFSENDYRVFFEQYRDKFIPEMYTGSIDEINLGKIISRCKENNLTVNELITSALSVATVETLDNDPDGQIRLGVVANTRNELTTEPHYCMGDYVTGISVNVRHVPKRNFMKNVAAISRAIRKKLTSLKSRHLIVNFLNVFDTDLVESIMFASYGNYHLPISKKIGGLIKEGIVKKGLGVSNLGRHEFHGYDTIKLLDIQFIGPAFPANLLSASMITVNNRLNICLRYNAVELKTNDVENVYKRTVELLS